MEGIAIHSPKDEYAPAKHVSLFSCALDWRDLPCPVGRLEEVKISSEKSVPHQGFKSIAKRFLVSCSSVILVPAVAEHTPCSIPSRGKHSSADTSVL